MSHDPEERELDPATLALLDQFQAASRDVIQALQDYIERLDDEQAEADRKANRWYMRLMLNRRWFPVLCGAVGGSVAYAVCRWRGW